MSAVTAEKVKALRESTGCAMRRCKELLRMAEGDLEVAAELTRCDGYAVMCYRGGEPISYPEMIVGSLLAAKEERSEDGQG